ncbi:MAG: CDP-alcohol phosphatidyltransferase family protein [Xanthobacteraceae bacterium]
MASDRPATLKEDTERTFSAAERACAFAVHILTASGAAVGLLALIAAVHGNWSWMFLWLGIALVLDAFDGTLARRFKVAERLPHWSGDSLDFIVDFVTYVFVPAYAVAMSGLLPGLAAIPLGVLIVVTGALYFADQRMKTLDNYFRGFPVLWNIAAFYLFLLTPPPWIGAAGVIVLVLLTFAPLHFIHPVRVARWRYLNVILLLLWSALAAAALAQDMSPAPWITLTLCAIGLYFLASGLARSPAGEGSTNA